MYVRDFRVDSYAHTGGFAVGAIFTRSSPASSAILMASLVGIMPSCAHILDDFAKSLSDVAVVEKNAKVEGRSMTMFLTEKR